jgi:hypothetical protein
MLVNSGCFRSCDGGFPGTRFAIVAPRRPFFQRFWSHRVAPGLRVGRGLKHSSAKSSNVHFEVAPGLRVGRGLKHSLAKPSNVHLEVAPGLRVGRGLEQNSRVSMDATLMAVSDRCDVSDHSDYADRCDYPGSIAILPLAPNPPAIPAPRTGRRMPRSLLHRHHRGFTS